MRRKPTSAFVLGKIADFIARRLLLSEVMKPIPIKFRRQNITFRSQDINKMAKKRAKADLEAV